MNLLVPLLVVGFWSSALLADRVNFAGSEDLREFDKLLEGHRRESPRQPEVPRDPQHPPRSGAAEFREKPDDRGPRDRAPRFGGPGRPGFDAGGTRVRGERRGPEMRRPEDGRRGEGRPRPPRGEERPRP